MDKTDSKSDSKKIEFMAPEGFTIPNVAKAEEDGGKRFEVVCTFEVKDGNNLCLTKIGDSDAPGYGKNGAGDKPETAPDYKGMSQNMATAMSDYSGGDRG